ncbi:hypothetical protein [Komagataeibacter oboediens]|uniref:Uncharacterized protein n=1 Tax=Komagataeibacter oboediens TaxID=65958 RepID=A0ABS5SQV5_9PROT|nr:hypothetical protein [Komagataeibacter oboediens]MBL7233375.1 hypothetical protein [Komagataeibacter oboediens]MBT0676677.1 hypothetical protein [Komagataeibacter oboediens]MBT0678202.1 hypothetical protein [Komagataeibacter oboediens]
MSNTLRAGVSRFAFLNRSAAEDDDTNTTPDNGGGDDDTDENGKKKGKKADGKDEDPCCDDGDDTSDAEDDADAEKASARARERGRCAAIFSSKFAANNPAAAAEIAFGTSMPRSAAVRLLSTMGAVTPPAAKTASQSPAREGLRERMGREPGAPPLPAGGNDAAQQPGARLAAIANARKTRKR